MSAPVTVFLLTAAVVFCVHLSYQIPFYRAVSRLAAKLKQHGIQWSYWSDWRLQQRFHSDPGAIYCDTDTAEIRTIKREVVERRQAIFASLKLMLKILGIGFALTIVAGIVEVMLKGK
jgi:hypothetical protein